MAEQLNQFCCCLKSCQGDHSFFYWPNHLGFCNGRICCFPFPLYACILWHSYAYDICLQILQKDVCSKGFETSEDKSDFFVHMLRKSLAPSLQWMLSMHLPCCTHVLSCACSDTCTVHMYMCFSVDIGCCSPYTASIVSTYCLIHQSRM